MCVTGGRRCPGCSNRAGLDAHNARRRHNRAIRREIAAWAGQNDQPPEVVQLLRNASPTVVKDWAARHLIDPTAQQHHGSATVSGSNPAWTPGNRTTSWLSSPALLDQISAIIRRQGQLRSERDLLSGSVNHYTQIYEGSNETIAVQLSTNVEGFHKTFSGVNTSAACGYDQDGYQQPIHEVAAWRVATTLGQPWDQIVAPAVLREVNGELGSFSRLLTGSEGAGHPNLRSAAAMFDSLIGQQDRHSENWITDGTGVGLIDHGFAFATPGDGFNASDFVVDRYINGSANLEPYERQALTRLMSSDTQGSLENILEPRRADALRHRAEKMLSSNRILPIHEF